MPDEIDLLRRFRDEVPGPSTDAWARARAAIAAARAEETPARSRNVKRRGWHRRVSLVVVTGAAAAVAALLAVLLPGSLEGQTGREEQIQTTAYVARVQHALAHLSSGGLVGYARTVLPPGSRMQLGTGNMASGPGVRSPLGVGVTVTWSYGGTSTTYGFTPSGQRVFAAESATVAGGTAGHEVAVIYSDATWWRATLQPTNGQPPATAPVCAPGVSIGAGGWPAFIRYELGCGEFREVGRQRVDGVEAVKLTGSNGTTAWVNPSTYLPVRVIVGGLKPTQIDFRWLTPTRANLAQLTVRVPSGFRKVPPP